MHFCDDGESLDHNVTNASASNKETEEDWLVSPADDPAAVAVPILFAIIFIVGIVGNGTLIFIVLRNKAMRTKTNVHIVSLAIGDFFLIFVSVPFTSTLYTFTYWPFGNTACKLNEFMQTLSLGVSIFTLVALSADRFTAIVYPLTAYSSKSLRRVLAACLFIWIISIGLALMDLIGADVRPCQHCCPSLPICHPYPYEWGENYMIFRIVFRFMILFLVPMMIILILYSIIAVVLLRQSESLNTALIPKTAIPASSPSVSKQNNPILRQIESRKNVAIVVLSFVVIFVVCWLPRHIYVMCYNFLSIEFNMFWHVFKITSFCLAFVYSAINPLALFLLNEEYRRYYRHYLFGCCYKPWRLKYSQRRNTTTIATEVVGLQTMMATSNASLDDMLSGTKKCSV